MARKSNNTMLLQLYVQAAKLEAAIRTKRIERVIRVFQTVKMTPALKVLKRQLEVKMNVPNGRVFVDDLLDQIEAHADIVE